MIKVSNGRVKMTGTTRELEVEFMGVCEGIYRDLCKGDNERFMGLVEHAKEAVMMTEEEKNYKIADMLQELIDMIKGEKNDEED